MAEHVLGIEIGGTKLQAALGTRDGEILALERGAAPTAGGAEAILEWFTDTVPTLLAQADEDSVMGIGVGFGGPVDTASGTALVSHQVGGWNGFPLRTWFEERFDLPTFVANDASTAGWGEYKLGCGRDARHFAYMNIGSGIGGALIVNGELHDGQGRGGGEIGHTLVPDGSGGATELENCCSGWAIERRLRSLSTVAADSPLAKLCGGDPGRLTCPMLAEAARQDDPLAGEVMVEIAEPLGIALANLITLFHPERIALGGGVSLMGDVLLDPLRAAVACHVFEPFAGGYTIQPCELEETVVIAGALLLAP
jgi:glucokinase